MKIAEVVKFVASTATGLGVGKTVDLILKNNLPIDMNWKVRVATFIGSTAISSYISAKCSEHIEGEIDKVVEFVEKIKEENDKQILIEHVEVAEEISEEK